MEPINQNENNHEYVVPNNEVRLDGDSDLIGEDHQNPPQYPSIDPNRQPRVQLSTAAEVNAHPLDSPIDVNPIPNQGYESHQAQPYQSGGYNIQSNPNPNNNAITNVQTGSVLAPPAGMVNQPQQNYGQNVVVVQERKVIYTGKPFPCCLAYTCFVINLFLPGIGTMIGVCGMNDRNVKIAYICSGCCQLFTFICLIGWCFALCTSILYIMASGSNEPFESFLAEKKEKKEVQIAMVSVPNINNNQNQQPGTNNYQAQYNQPNLNVNQIDLNEKAQNYRGL